MAGVRFNAQSPVVMFLVVFQNLFVKRYPSLLTYHYEYIIIGDTNRFGEYTVAKYNNRETAFHKLLDALTFGLNTGYHSVNTFQLWILRNHRMTLVQRQYLITTI